MSKKLSLSQPIPLIIMIEKTHIIKKAYKGINVLSKRNSILQCFSKKIHVLHLNLENYKILKILKYSHCTFIHFFRDDFIT